MLKTPLWQCPVCNYHQLSPVQICERCGCNLLKLVKIKIHAQDAIIRAERVEKNVVRRFLQRLKKLLSKKSSCGSVNYRK